MYGLFYITREEAYQYTEWFILSLLTCLLSYPIFFIAAVIKFRGKKDSIIAYSLREAWKSLGPMLVGVYIVGFFVVSLLLAIGFNLFYLVGVPEKYFNIDAYPWFFFGSIFAVYGLWYLVCLAYVIRNMPWSR